MINSFETLFEARERKFQQEKLFRGESVDLVARITTDGVLDNLSSYAISGVYQAVDDPDGHIYSINSEILNGKAILHWTDENDFGKNAYNVWGLLTKDGKAAYPIAWRLNFAHSPSYPLSAIDPLVRTIDFDNYDLLNAPWLPLSGDTMYENSFIRFPVDEDTSIQFDKDGIEKLSATTLTTEPMSGYCWHTIIDPVPDYEIQWFTESELANWNYEESIPPWQNSRLRLCATKPAETHTDVSTIVNLSVPNDEEGDRTIATREWTQENTDEKLNDYLPLSGGTVTGELSVTGTFGSSNFKADAGVGIMIGYNAKAKSGSIAIGSSSDVTNAYFGGSNVAVGTAAKIGSTSQTDCAVAVGNGATVNGNHGIAIGHAADAVGANSIAIGSSGSRVQATAPESIQIGGLSNGLWTPNNTPHSLKVFDKMVLSGDNLTLDPERIPYLSAYETKVAAATEHQTLSTDLTAYVEERIGEIPQPDPPPVAGVLTIKKNETTIVEYNPDSSQNLTATITVPTKVTDLDDNIGIATQNELSTNYATKNEVNNSFNNARSYTDEQIEALSSTYETKQHASDTYQTKSDAVADLAFVNGKISDVATDLSTNYATKSYANEISGEVETNRNNLLIATTNINDLSSSLSGTQIQMALYDGKFALPETVVEYYGGAVDLFDLNGHVNFDMLSTALGEYDQTKTVQRISFGTNVTDLSVGISYKYNVIVSGSTATPEFQILDDEATISAKRHYLYNWFRACDSIELPLTLQAYGFELGRYEISSESQPIPTEYGNTVISKFDFKVDFGKWIHGDGDGIKPFAFTGMKNVKEISYPFATELTFGPHPFDYCYNLEIVDIRNVTSIGCPRLAYKVRKRVMYTSLPPTIENVNPNLKIIVSDSEYTRLMGVSLFSTWHPYLVKASDYEDIHASDLSAAISSIPSETWTFTLDDDTTVTKNVLIG